MIPYETMWILIEVDTVPGEDSTRLTEVDPGTIEEITPLLLRIFEYQGWFPTRFYESTVIGSTPWETYAGEFGPEAYDTLLRLLPSPPSGFLRVKKVLCWGEEPMSLYMYDN